MAKFRKRQTTVEAEQWVPGRKIEGVVESDRELGAFYAHAWIETPEGTKQVSRGDWILIGAMGVKCVIDDDAFRTLYEPVFEDDDQGIDVDEPQPTEISKVETEILTIRPSRRVLGIPPR
jgi:hypothetical protein